MRSWAQPRDGRELLTAAERLKPDLIVADISMPLLNGIEALRRIKKACLRTKVIILSMHADVEFGVEALRSGASGYVVKHSASEALSLAIREALEGRIYVSPGVSDRGHYPGSPVTLSSPARRRLHSPKESGKCSS